MAKGRKSRLYVVGIWVFVVALCGLTLTVSGEKVLRWPVNENPMTLDPGAAFANTSLQIMQNLFDSVVRLDNDMKVIPALAESWDISEDGTVYTFHLRKDVRFHNGKHFTAHDVKYSWERALWPETGNPTTFFLYPIEGAEAVEKGETRELSGVTVVDDYTLQVKLSNPAGYFLVLSAAANYYVVDKETVEKYGLEWTKAGNLIGTGAYKLAEWLEGVHITLVANPDYYGGKPVIDRVEIPVIPDASTAMLRYEAGELDIVPDLTPADVLRFSRDPERKQELQITPILRTTWLGFHMNMEPFSSNKALREAVAYGIDREKLVKVVLQGAGIPAYSYLPLGMPCHNPDLKPYYFDLEKAKDKMAEAGFPNGEGLDQITISLPEDEVPAFEFIQAQLLTNLGIRSELQVIPGTSYWGRLITHEFAVFRASMGADYPDAQELLEYLFLCGYSTNYGEYCNPAFDVLVLAGNKEADMETRCVVYGAAERILLEDATMIPLFYPSQTAVVKPYVKGFKYTPLYAVTFNQVDIADH